MASQLLGYSGKPADYTATIAKQKDDEYFTCYPEHPKEEDYWDVYTGTLIQFVNTTEESIRVTVKPDVYQGANPFTIAPYSRTICTVLLTQKLIKAGTPITHTIVPINIDGTNAPTGGPKMVPTDPDS